METSPRSKTGMANPSETLAGLTRIDERVDERPPGNHTITSSARSSSDGGIVRPMAFAVHHKAKAGLGQPRLITISHAASRALGSRPGLGGVRLTIRRS